MKLVRENDRDLDVCNLCGLKSPTVNRDHGGLDFNELDSLKSSKTLSTITLASTFKTSSASRLSTNVCLTKLVVGEVRQHDDLRHWQSQEQFPERALLDHLIEEQDMLNDYENGLLTESLSAKSWVDFAHSVGADCEKRFWLQWEALGQKERPQKW